MNQARQFITHRQVMVGAKEITSPSYLATMAEAATVSFKPTCALASADHPERVRAVTPVKEEPATPTPKATAAPEKTTKKE